VTVIPVNQPPVISDQIFSLNEDSENGTVVGSVIATDPDGDVLAFSISAGNTDDVFIINSTTGELTVNNSPVLDFETTASFSLTVQVDDGNGETTSASITVNLNDIDETITGVANKLVAEQLKLYPNPAGNLLHLEVNNEYYGILKLVITDLSGKHVYEIETSKINREWDFSIDVTILMSGAYLLNMQTGTSAVFVRFLKDWSK